MARKASAKKVREVMTERVDCLGPENSAAEAARHMKRLNVGAIPVCQGEDLYGIVTDRDIVVRVVAEGKDLATTLLRDCCTRELVTIEPEADVRRAAEIMAEHQIRRLPVVQGKRLVGIVSLGDLAVKAEGEKAPAKALTEISKPAEPEPVEVA